MDKELKNKDIEQVSGGFQFDPELHIDPESYSHMGMICVNRYKGTEACELDEKGKLTECSGCSKNHD